MNNYIPKICSSFVLGFGTSQGILNPESGIGPRKWCINQKNGPNTTAKRANIANTGSQSISNLVGSNLIKYCFTIPKVFSAKLCQSAKKLINKIIMPLYMTQEQHRDINRFN